MFPSDRKNRKRRAGAFEWYQDDTNTGADNLEPPTVRRKHTDISVNIAGPSSTQSSFVDAPASPVKPRASEPMYRDDYLLHQMGLEIEVVEDGLAGVFDDVEGQGEEIEDDVDPQYQRHLEDNAVDGGIGKTRRKRTPAVRYAISNSPVTHTYSQPSG